MILILDRKSPMSIDRGTVGVDVGWICLILMSIDAVKAAVTRSVDVGSSLLVKIDVVGVVVVLSVSTSIDRRLSECLISVDMAQIAVGRSKS